MGVRTLFLPALAAFCLISTAFGSDSLRLYNWPNYIPPQLLERFESETGIEIAIELYESNESMLKKVRAGDTSYDIVVPSDYMVRFMIAEGLAVRIDTSRMANFENVSPPHDSPPFDPQRKYSAPYMWGTTGFAYDSSRSPELEPSWKEFFEPREELKGMVVSLNDPVDTWNAAAHYLGIDICTESPEDADRIQQVLEKQKSHLAMYSSSGVIERMAAGEVIMHQMWNGAAHRARAERESITYVYPEEGLDVWGDHFLVPKGAPNPENARTFINWMMNPRNAAEASNYTGYMNAIAGSVEYLDTALRSDPAINMPKEYVDRLRPLPTCAKTSRELRDRVWKQLRR